jgi:transcriptional regulator with XRE-family HTH domain
VAEPTELADFLRARREHLTPADVGLPDHGRRRTPGLRREEVATLAGVSVDYLVRLEQGRDTNPSPSVLAALAKALRLSEEERAHLGHLVLRANNAEMCPSVGTLPTEVRPTVVRMLEQLDPIPAHVLGPLGDVLAANDAWRSLVLGTGLASEPTPNLTAFVFLDPSAVRLFRDWDAVADGQAGRLRSAQARWGTEPRYEELLDRLRASAAFVERWEAHAVDERPRGVLRLDHPEVGELRLVHEALLLADEDQRLVSWLPNDDVSEKALRELLRLRDPVSPARLRIVGDD